jgi:hypothetical protein
VCAVNVCRVHKIFPFVLAWNEKLRLKLRTCKSEGVRSDGLRNATYLFSYTSPLCVEFVGKFLNTHLMLPHDTAIETVQIPVKLIT